MPTVSVNGADLYYEVRGSGPPILFINGAFSDVAHFARLGDLLSDEFTIVTYDRRGYSRSSAATGPTGPSQQADDAAGLLAALSLAPAAVHGNSSGAIIALDLLIRHPGAAMAGVLHEPPLMSALAHPDEVLAVVRGLVEQAMATGGTAAAAEAFVRFVGGDANWESFGPDGQDRIKKNGPTFFECEFGNFEPYRPADETLAEVTAPVQVLASDGSPPFFAEAAGWLADRLGTELARIPGTHIAHLDHPEQLAQNIRVFVRGCLDRAATR